ncbi:hypothetical protein L1887_50709 [Cichorium endivia]|nr:hypothetical protein L1887_50709 [Cichorium endivia]
MPLMLDEIIDLGIAAVAACLRRLQHPSAVFSLGAAVIIFWPFGLLSSLPPPLPSPPQSPTPESEPPESEPPESPPLEILTPGFRWIYTSLGYVPLPVPEPLYLPSPVPEQLPVYERPPDYEDVVDPDTDAAALSGQGRRPQRDRGDSDRSQCRLQ